MKILWVKTDFLHPTNRGGQIRTLEMLRRLHARHEVHYVAFDNPDFPEGPRRAQEYSTRSYPLPHYVPSKTSPAFAVQLVKGLLSPLPVAIGRYASERMRRLLEDLTSREQFDSIVCDFLAPAPNIPRLEDCVLFQHNVETMIWRRHCEHAGTPLKRWYLQGQARRMFEYERRVCGTVRHVIAVSPNDADIIKKTFGLPEVSDVPTGVDLEYFAPGPPVDHKTDLVFVGSMDWLPNIDGASYFVREILPLIRRRRPDCTLDVVGRSPSGAILALAAEDSKIRVTGTVPDVRPYLWGAAVSIVPLRIGGGTRLKIYESMAARTAVVSTTIGAEGLLIHPPRDIRIADEPQDFAAQCVQLLERRDEREQVSAAAWKLVSERFSWEQVTRGFEDILARHSLRTASRV